MLPSISQNLTVQEAFETIAQIDEQLKRTEAGGVLCKKLKLPRLTQKIGGENNPSKER